MFWHELQLELAVDVSVVSAALRTGHHSHPKNVLHVTLAQEHIVEKMPMFEPMMYSNCFQPLFLLADCVVNDELVLSSKLE